MDNHIDTFQVHQVWSAMDTNSKRKDCRSPEDVSRKGKKTHLRSLRRNLVTNRSKERISTYLFLTQEPLVDSDG
jgi:hypothetical protein